MVVLTTHPASLLGQETPSDPSLGNEPAQAEIEGPEDASKVEPEKRRLGSRLGPQQLTPEQQEEAARLRKLAAKYGTDPTAIVGRMQLSSAYYDFPREARAVDTVIRADLPLRGRYLLRVDAPFLKWSDPNRAGATSATGFSDLAVTLGWRAYNTPGYAILVGVISTMPTGTETGLSLGKYTVGPTIATARVLPDYDTFLVALFTQQLSVGGDPARKDFNLSRATLAATTLWTGKWWSWSTAQAVFEIDWERKGKTGLTLELEVGRNVIERWDAFVRPGVGVFGQGVGGVYDWNIEVGIRRMFKSF